MSAEHHDYLVHLFQSCRDQTMILDCGQIGHIKSGEKTSQLLECLINF